MKLQLPNQTINLTQPLVVGIVNVTPDSFSDGGQFLDPEKAVQQALNLEKQGAGMIDLGAESTRPNALPVSAKNQLNLLLPVLDLLKNKLTVPISVDTGDAEVITEIAKTQVAMINDVYALQKQGALKAVAKTNMAVCLMHMQNSPSSMQQNPKYKNIVDEVKGFLQERLQASLKQGVNLDSIALDPGFGFGKSVAHNFSLLKGLSRLQIDALPLYVGLSRKSMFKQITQEAEPKDRLFATIGAEVFAVMQGAKIIRTHNVRASCEAIKSALEAYNATI